jgi:hypothetical protein
VNLSEVKRLHNPKPYSSPLLSRVQRNGQSWSNIQKDHSLTDTAKGGCRRKDLALQSVCLSLSLSLPSFLPLSPGSKELIPRRVGIKGPLLSIQTLARREAASETLFDMIDLNPVHEFYVQNTHATWQIHTAMLSQK